MNYQNIFKTFLVGIISIISVTLGENYINEETTNNYVVKEENDVINLNNLAYVRLTNSPNKLILDAIPEEDLIIYEANDQKFVVTIFTDVFCPYCRDLHRKLNDFLENGITVRYAPFPLQKESVKVLASIWCATDSRKLALDMAMFKMRMRDLGCNQSYLSDFMEIARSLNVTGTPSIFFEDGRKVKGFYSALDINNILLGRMRIKE